MTIRTYHPQASVVLTKIVARDKKGSKRFQGFDNRIELTKFLGEYGGIKTVKSVHDGAGVFTITCTDEKSLDGRDSLYGLVEPMDHVEIRMSHEPHKHAGGDLPIIMRGFVSEVRRTETMGGDGKPVRAVVIAGQDYTKLLMQLQIFYEKSFLLKQKLLTSFRLFVNSGVRFDALRSNDFITEVVTKIVDPYMAKLVAVNENAAGFKAKLNLELSVSTGTVAPFGINPYEGTIWNFLRTWGDMPWNELFIQSREKGEYLVYRPVPYKDLNRNLIQTDAKDPGTVEITDRDVVTMELSRGDRNVANYYWVTSTRADMASHESLRIFAVQAQGSIQDFFLSDYPNADPVLYGNRKMEVPTQQGHSNDRSRLGDGLPEAGHKVAMKLLAVWAGDRRRLLAALNRDNVVYEQGSMTLRGNETIRAGMYLALERGALTAEYYVNTVAHDFKPFRSYMTTVTVNRGTGFLERIASGSPYEAEGRRGVYDG